MQARYFLIISFMLLLFSCKETKQQQYYLKDKWKTKVLPYTTLKNKPTSVTEFFYRGIENINTDPLPTHGSYELFKFNKDGDPVEYTFHLSADKTFTVTTKYTDKGYEEFMNNQSTQGFEEKMLKDFSKDEDGFKETTWPLAGDKEIAGVNYLNNGNEIRREEIKDDSVDGRSVISKTMPTSLYDGQRPLKQMLVTSYDGSEITTVITFYYSKTDQLDSIVNNFAGNISVTHFKNNSNGDPIEEITMKNGDTTAFYKREYIYDKKNNWTRMLEKEVKGDKTPAGQSPYVLIDRKIFHKN